MLDLEETSEKTLPTSRRPRIAIATITYDDAFGLDKLIQSTKRKVKLHIIIGGKFPNHPGIINYAQPWTEEMEETWQVINRYREQGYKIHYEIQDIDEYSKRMMCLWIAELNNIDALLILDSDEYIDSKRTNWNQFYKDVADHIWDDNNVFGIIGYWGVDNEKPRLWMRPSEMTYVNGSHKIFKNKHHNNFLDRDGCMEMNPIKIKSLSFIQDSSYRTKQRQKDHDEYYKWLIKHEASINFL
jgi:hypothetical protein